MTTAPSNQIDDKCLCERVDKDHRTYLCGRTASVNWYPLDGADLVVPLCSSCLRWLKTLESLGQPLT